MTHDNHWAHTNGYQVNDSCMSCDPWARLESQWRSLKVLISSHGVNYGWPRQVPCNRISGELQSLHRELKQAHHFLLLLVPCGGCVRRKRFRGCQGEGQRSAGVRKSISLRSLSSPFNVMKPLLVKASAWRPALWSKARMGSRTERRKGTPLAHPPSANSTGVGGERYTIPLDVGSPSP